MSSARLGRWAGWVALALLSLATAIIIWSASRGLDLSDESSFLLGYRHPEETLNSVTFFWLLLGRSWNWLQPSVGFYRWLRLILDLAASGVFAWGFFSFLRRHNRPAAGQLLAQPLALSILLAGTLLTYAGVVRTVCYNTLNFNAMLVFSGLLLRWSGGTSAGGAGRSADLWYPGILGAVTVFHLLVKFPAALALLLWSTLFASSQMATRAWRPRPASAFFFLFGMAMAAAVFFLWFMPPQALLHHFASAWRSWSQGMHRPAFFLQRYLADGRDTGWLLGRHFGLAGLAFIFYGWLWRRRSQKAPGQSGAVLPVLGLAVAAIYSGLLLSVELYNPTRFALAVLAAVVALTLGHRLGAMGRAETETRPPGGMAWLAVYLCALPLTAAWGTDTPITNNLSHYLSPWYALALLGLLTLAGRPAAARLAVVAALMVVAATAVFSTARLLFHMYRIPTSLQVQDEPVPGGACLKGLRLDTRSRSFIEKFRREVFQRTTLQPGQPVISIYDFPGLVCALDGVSPGTPWFHLQETEQPRNCSALLSSRRPDLERAVILLSVPVLPQTFLDCLQRAGIPFPQRYRRVGRYTLPHRTWDSSYVEVWAVEEMIRQPFLEKAERLNLRPVNTER